MGTFRPMLTQMDLIKLSESLKKKGHEWEKGTFKEEESLTGVTGKQELVGVVERSQNSLNAFMKLSWNNLTTL